MFCKAKSAKKTIFFSFSVLDNFSVFQKNGVFGYSWSTLLWYRCYYPHRSRDALSPICRIFKESALGQFFHRVAMSVCLCVCGRVPFRVVYFEAYFAPTSRNRMSKIFRYLESLGKSAGKKWSQNWTFLLGSGLKLPRKKKFFFFTDFALQNMVETTLPDGLETSGRRVYR